MIDWTALEQLRSDIGAQAVDEVLSVFRRDTAATLERFGQEEDPRQAARLVHFLKGGALNLGFTAFAAACARAEEGLRRGDAPADHLAGLRQLFADTLAAYERGPGS